MTNLSTPFMPDWVSPPGETILDIAEERGWSQKELAARLGFSEKHVSQLIKGDVTLTFETAMRLERVLGSNCNFWLSRENKYREHKARLEAARQCQEWQGWLDELPIAELKKSGHIDDLRLTPKNRPTIVEHCLRFFGVASPDEWRSYYAGMQVSFRRSRIEQTDIGAISSWLRIGEISAENIDTPKFNRARFESSLHAIRKLTVEDPENFQAKMIDLLKESGVVFALIPSIPRAHVSGVARWLTPSRPLIQMSLYGKSNDRFWFTFFHEAAHILLHANSNEEKKSVFLDDPVSSESTDIKEIEANKWASEMLIPESEMPSLVGLRSKASVIEFANHIGVHPGIVVGRMQHEGVIDPSWFNDLKQRYQLINP